MNFIITSPYFPENFQNFSHRLKQWGVNVLGIGQEPYSQLGPDLQGSLAEYYRVNNMEDFEEVKRAVAFLFYKHGPIHRIESHNEHWMILDATLRQQFDVPGNKPADIEKVKKKSIMEAYFRQAQVPVLEGQLIQSKDDFHKALKKLGLPIVAKPDLGVGAAATYKLDSQEAADQFLASWDPEIPYFVEPYVEDGILCSYDGLIDSQGEIVFESGFVYNHPTLELLRDQLDLAYVVQKDLDPRLLDYGRATIEAFGMKERFFHVEFFKLPNGDYIALEYNNRLPGGFTVDLYNHTFGIDLFDLYARIVAGEKVEKVGPSQQFGVGITQRYAFQYQNYEEDIYHKYGNQVKMSIANPPVFSALMGDHMYIITAESQEAVDEIIHCVHQRI